MARYTKVEAWAIVFFIIILLVVFSAYPRSDEPIVALTVSPAFQFSPGTIRLRISIAPHDMNVLVCYGYQGEEMSSLSCRPLDGMESPRVFQQEYHGLVGGYYVAMAQIYRLPNKLAGESIAEFTVIPRS